MGGFTASGINYIKSESLSYNGNVDTSKFARISPQTHAALKRSQIQTGDILYSIAGVNLGKCGIARAEMLPANTNQAVAIIRVDHARASAAFISYFLRSRLFVDQVLAGVAQSAQPNINLTDIGNFRVPALSLREQQHLAAVLEPLDDKIELNRRMNETLEAMAQAIFRDWFVDFGPVRRKLGGERDPVAIMGDLTPDPARAAKLAALFPDALNDAGLPATWQHKTVGSVAEVFGGKQLHKSKIAEAGAVPVFGGAGLMGFTDEANASGFVITVGRVGAYCGQFVTHNGEAWVNNNASRVKQKAGISGEWLVLALRQQDMQVIRRGAAQPFVSNGDIERLTLVWPGADFLACFQELVAPLFRRQEVAAKENATLAETRDYLLPRLMSGKVRVAEAAEAAEAAA